MDSPLIVKKIHIVIEGRLSFQGTFTIRRMSTILMTSYKKGKKEHFFIKECTKKKIKLPNFKTDYRPPKSISMLLGVFDMPLCFVSLFTF